MKYTRLELESGLSKNVVVNLLAFFILVPLLAISFGKIAAAYFIVPYIQQKTQTTQYTANIGTSYQSEYFLLQAGVFTNNENAKILQRGIDSIHNGVCIINDKDSYRVIVDVSEDKNKIEELEKKLMDSGYGCIKSSMLFKKNNDTADYEPANLTIDLLESEKELIIKEPSDKLTEDIKQKKENLKTAYENLKATESNESKFKNDGNYYENILKSTDKIIAEAVNKNKSIIKEEFVNQLFYFKNIYDSNAQSN